MVCFIPIYSILDDKNVKIALEMSFTIFGNEFQHFGNEFRHFLEMSFGQIGQKKSLNKVHCHWTCVFRAFLGQKLVKS